MHGSGRWGVRTFLALAIFLTPAFGGMARADLGAPAKRGAVEGTSATAKTIAERPLRLGVFPRRTLARTLAMFTPLAEELGRALGREVRLEAPKDFDAFWKGVAQNRFDIVHYNQYHYIKARAQFGHRLVAKNEERGSRTVTGVVFVRADSGVESLAELKHKTIVFGHNRFAAQAYIAPTYLLRKGGLGANDYRERFAATACDAATAVYLGEAPAGAAPLACISDNSAVDRTQLTLLAQTGPIAHLPWAVSRDVSEALRQRIHTALMAMPRSVSGRAALAHARLTGLAPAVDAEYRLMRTIIAEVLHERY